MAPPATHAINAYLYNNLPFDMEKSFAPITVVARFPNVMVVHPSLGVKTLEELIAKAKANPGKIDFATSGVGSTSHLCISLFMAMAGIEMNHIPYKGTSQSLQDVITGRVGLMIDNLGPILPHIQSGALLAIGVSTADPVSLLPGVPPIATVVKGYQASSWNALSVPAKTPRSTVMKLSTEAQAALTKPEVIEKMRSIGSEPVGGSPDDAEKFFAEERTRWKRAVEVAKLPEAVSGVTALAAKRLARRYTAMSAAALGPKNVNASSVTPAAARVAACARQSSTVPAIANAVT